MIINSSMEVGGLRVGSTWSEVDDREGAVGSEDFSGCIKKDVTHLRSSDSSDGIHTIDDQEVPDDDVLFIRQAGRDMVHEAPVPDGKGGPGFADSGARPEWFAVLTRRQRPKAEMIALFVTV